tara:strand:+ start:2123 stop:4918 length:2796 start_codon:yes stop_codon:yes gene_type:complete
MIFKKLKLFLSVLLFISGLYSQDLDCTGIPEGSSVCLNYINIDSESGYFDIAYSSLNDIYGYQLNITGLNILSVDSDIGTAYFTEETGFVIGITLTGDPLPAGDGVLLSVNFDPTYETESCLQNILVSGSGGQSMLTEESCETIPSAPVDCMNEILGEAFLDDCSICSEGSSGHVANSDKDCNGDCFGGALIDDCDVCGGDNIDIDCNGDCFGDAYVDNCGGCDSDPLNDCEQDCSGNWGGSAELDECGICQGDNSTCLDCCGIPNGDGNTCAGECGPCNDNIDDGDCDCFGNKLDECNICGGDGYADLCTDIDWVLNNGSCENMDCSGECGSDLEFDICDVCGGNGWDDCDDNNNGISNYDEWGYGVYNIEIQDIPSDQGGWVDISFNKSFYDSDTLRSNEYYNIERLDGGSWSTLFSIAAYGSSNYSTEARTLQDSSSISNNALTYFRIISNMDEGNIVSGVLESYSIDNIHPTVPALAFADHEVNEVSLNWDYELEEDFNYHEILSLSGNVYSIENSLVFEMIESSSENNEHRVQSVDINGNYSDYSSSLLSRRLHAGANLISFNVLSEDNSVANVFESLGINATGVITEGGAATQIASDVWVGSLIEILPNKGYWVVLNEDDILLLIGSPTDRNETYDLHGGANLISFPYRYETGISDALKDDCEALIDGIITEGGAATKLPDGTWVGSMTHFKATKGYWVVIEEDCMLTFENGCDELECAPTARENQTIPSLVDYEYNQSTRQAFYFFDTIENIKEGDYILSFNGDKLTGVRQWQGSVIDVPVMGYDGNSYSDGYIEAGSVPSFKLLSDGELTLLDGDIPAWSDNGMFMVSNLSRVIVPEEFSLGQAYPNPFNPKTTLTFEIPVDNEVTLSIYNLQGMQVATLIEGNVSAGYHSVVWDANTYSSGVYLVRLVAGDYTKNQKLVLLK